MLVTGLLACSTSSPTIPAPSLADRTEATRQHITLQKPITQILGIPEDHLKVSQFSAAPELDLFRLSKELSTREGDVQQIISRKPIEYSVGDTETFWVMNLSGPRIYQSDFTLALVTPHAYWYIENNLDVSIVELDRSAANFEKNTYPAITKVFGNEWIPGIDNNPRLNILNASLANVAGYFSSTDEYPAEIRPKSNQREIIYINAEDVSPGSLEYDLVLSHELQHAIHWNADASEETWVNEGLSELASSVAWESTLSIREYLKNEPTSLIHWPTFPSNTLANYGAASLFMHFFTEHYGGRDNLKLFLAQPGDGIEGINQYLKSLRYRENFNDVFKQWAAANILDEHLQTGDEILGYSGLDIKTAVSRSINGTQNTSSDIPQYSVEYTQIKSESEPFELSFQGNTEVALLPIEIGNKGCWWSNAGDSIDSTLSHHIEAPIKSTAELKYEVWFDTEKNWDYVYIQVSVDGGKTWQIIETPKTSRDNPLGNAFGAGYTGKSNGWLTESVDLTRFTGKDLWVRLQYVTDDAINSAGACFRDFSISVDGITLDEYKWEAEGFMFTDNVVRQDFQVQLITVGDKPQVLQLPLDDNNSGTWTVQPPEDDNRFIIAVGSLAEKTRELSTYTLKWKPQ